MAFIVLSLKINGMSSQRSASMIATSGAAPSQRPESAQLVDFDSMEMFAALRLELTQSSMSWFAITTVMFKKTPRITSFKASMRGISSECDASAGV